MIQKPDFEQAAKDIQKVVEAKNKVLVPLRDYIYQTIQERGSIKFKTPVVCKGTPLALYTCDNITELKMGKYKDPFISCPGMENPTVPVMVTEYSDGHFGGSWPIERQTGWNRMNATLALAKLIANAIEQ